MTRATGGTRTSAENNSKDLVVLKCLLYLFSCDLDRQRRDEQDGLGLGLGTHARGGSYVCQVVHGRGQRCSSSGTCATPFMNRSLDVNPEPWEQG